MIEFFPQIGVVVLIAAAGGFIAKILKQPAIAFYIIAGLLLGPVFGILTNTHLINGLAEIGIAFLLFLVGIEIDLKKLKEVAKFSSVTATLITIFTAAAGFAIAYKLNFSNIESATLGFVFAFSSTMIVLKILTDRKELDTLHGRILITILLIQDIFAIIFLTILTSSSLNIINIILLIIKLILVILLVYFLSKTLIPKLLKFASESTELLFLISIAICFAFGILFDFAGMPIAIGAFAGGIAVSSSQYKFEILARIKPIRDFFAIIFFVSLGLLVTNNISGMWPTIIILTIFVIIIKPILIFLFASFSGYKNRTSFLTSVFLSQASEFSLIIAITGFNQGIFGEKILTITALVSIFSIIISSYLISYNQIIYKKIKSVLKLFEKKSTKEELLHLPPEKDLYNHTILFGSDRIGFEVAETLKKLERKFLVVDYNPGIIKKLRNKKISCIFGDATDSEIIDRINIDKAKMIISTIPNFEVNIMLLKKTKLIGKHPIIYLTATNLDEAIKLYKAGADYVIFPEMLGGSHVSHMIKTSQDKWEDFLKYKKDHLKKLKQRKKELGIDLF